MTGKWIALPLAAFVIAALAASPALAQTSTGGGKTGGSTGTGPGGVATPGPGSGPGGEMDLPLEKLPPAPKPPEKDDPPGEGDPPKLYDEEIPTEEDEIVYVIDISGSMDWGGGTYTDPDGNVRRGTKLDKAKAELIKSVNGLSDNFTFNIFAYHCSIRQFAPRRVEATAANKQAAAGWTLGLRADSATGTGPAVSAALRDRDCTTFVLLSDGAPNCIGNNWYDTPEHLQMILANNVQKAKIHTFGIECTGRFRAFMVDIATKTGGMYRDAG